MDKESQLQIAVQLQSQFSVKVRELVSPALMALKLDYFWYVRLLEGSFHLSIGIQAPSIDLYRKRRTEDLYFNNPQILAQRQTTVIWDLHEPTSLTSDMKEIIGLQNGMCLFRRRKKYIEIWYVASRNKQSNLYQLYINNTPAIYRLIAFFQEEVLPLLPMKDPDFLLPYMDNAVLQLPPLLKKGKNPELTDFYDATTMKKFTLHSDDSEFNLSLRELQCIHRLAQGETAKEIAKGLGLSYRTVEHYIQSARRQAKCLDKSELVALYRSNDIATWFDD